MFNPDKVIHYTDDGKQIRVTFKIKQNKWHCYYTDLRRSPFADLIEKKYSAKFHSITYLIMQGIIRDDGEVIEIMKPIGQDLFK